MKLAKHFCRREMPRLALVAEDDEPIRRLIARVLQRQQLVVHTARNGREAIDALKTTDFDVIVLDLMMPEVSGFEVLHFLREVKPQELKCLIVVTAVSERELIRTLGEDRSFRVLRKPFDIAELARTVADSMSATPEGTESSHTFTITCLSCDAASEFDGESDKAAREEARAKGWHVVSFVKEDTATGQKKTLFITFCPTCASPAAT